MKAGDPQLSYNKFLLTAHMACETAAETALP